MEPGSAPHPGQPPYRAPSGAIYVQHTHNTGSCALNTLTGTRRSIEIVFHCFQAIISAYTIYHILYTIHFQTSHGYFSGSAWYLFFSSALSLLSAVCYGFLAWWTRRAVVKERTVAAMRFRLQRRVDLEPVQKEGANVLLPCRSKRIRFAAFMLSHQPRAWMLLGLVALTAIAVLVQGYRIRNGTDCGLYEESLRRFCESTLVAVGALFIASVLWMLWLAFWFIVSSSSTRRARSGHRGRSNEGPYLGEITCRDGSERAFQAMRTANADRCRRAGSEQERGTAGICSGEGSDNNSSTAYSSLKLQRQVQILMPEQSQDGSSVEPRSPKPEADECAPFHTIELEDDSDAARKVTELGAAAASRRRSRSVDVQARAVEASEKVSGHSNTLPRTRHSVLFSGAPLPPPENQLQGQREFERLMHEHLQAIGAIRPESIVDEGGTVAGRTDSRPSRISLEDVFSPTVPTEETSKGADHDTAGLRMSMSSPNLRGLQKATASSLKATLGPLIPSSMSASRGGSGDQRSGSVYDHLHPARSSTLPNFEASSDKLLPRPSSVVMGPGSTWPRSLGRAGHFSMPAVGVEGGARPTSTSSEYSLLSPHDLHRLQKFWEGKVPYPPPPSPTAMTMTRTTSTTTTTTETRRARTRTSSSSQQVQTPGSPPLTMSLVPDLDRVEKERILKRTSQVFSLQQPQIRQLVRQKSQMHLPAIPLQEGPEGE
ncbi:unnamed protein product [Mortierella alpina]